MEVSKLVSRRFKETPADCQIQSQALMIRGGYIKAVGNGIYTLLPPAKRILRKIENIIREEMDAIDGQEVLFPVAMPASLWKESGRYDSIGSELLRFKDRSGGDMVLGMTHEEAAVHLARDVADSYAQYPFMIYQIQTKFRDEPRTRGGLIRVREFTMKDAYSFHTSQEDLEAYYRRCYDAYHRIFARVGLPQVVAVQSDSGMMGGKIAHEYMLLTEVGEDSIVLCPECGYRANMEAAPSLVRNEPTEPKPLTKLATPGVKTIEALCDFLQITPAQTCKAVVYQRNQDDGVVIAFLRGDLDVNETKLRNHLGYDIHPAVFPDGEAPLALGFCGPLGLPEGVAVVFDSSLQGLEDLVAGANEPDCHLAGLCLARDVGRIEYVDVAKARQGGVCPACSKAALDIRRGIEVGNIFQLGVKYTASMGMRYVDQDGSLKTPLMGCYGIGLGRLAASVCEVSRDEYGPIWPISIAPWQVHLCGLRADQPEVAQACRALYGQLEARGLEVILDNRPVSAGVMFSDADLLGVPVRVVISPRGLKAGTAEVSKRDKSLQEKPALDQTADFVEALVREELQRLNARR